MRPIFVAPLFYTICLLLAGCSQVSPQASDLAWPRASLMKKSPDLPPVKAGDDIYQDDVQCRAHYARETGRIESLQGYVRTIHKK